MLLRPPTWATRTRQGDVTRATRAARNAQQAREFYQAVLQVPFTSGEPGEWLSATTGPPLGVRSSAGAEPAVQPSYHVDDIAAAVERVRAAGGHAEEPEHTPDGLVAECTDDQGATLRLWQPPG